MKKQILVVFVSLILLMPAGSSFVAAATMENYCQVPPFISNAVPPNIFFTVDVSGSMGWEAYSYGDSDGNSDGMLDNYQKPNGNEVYEGYFTPDKYYQLDASN